MARVYISVVDKIASDAPLRFKDEFCPWAGISPAYGYELVKDGKLKLTRVGKTNYVTSANRRACIALITGEDDAAPAAAGSSPIAKPAPAAIDDRRKRRHGRPEVAERRERIAGPAAAKSADPVDAV